MKVSPLDIQQKRFHVAFRGYERAEVDVFLDTVREEMEGLVREVTELREFRGSYDERMREFHDREETLKSTLITTHKLAEDIKINARREAELIAKDAELKYHQTLERVRQEKLRLDAEIKDLTRRKHHFQQDLEKVLQMHMEMLKFERGEGEGEAGPAAG